MLKKIGAALLLPIVFVVQSFVVMGTVMVVMGRVGVWVFANLVESRM